MEKKNEVLDLSFEFALLIVEFVEILDDAKKYLIAKQLLRSGTSIGANIHESQSAESRTDFIHKLKIAHKEVYETEYWIKLVIASKSYPNPSDELQSMLLSLKKILGKIISSTKFKMS